MLTELTQMRFADRVAVITGGANGIGRATAVLLAKEGAKVVAVDVEPQRLRELESSIRADGGSCTTFEADVLDAQAVECLANFVVGEFRRADILVNSVGGSTVIPDTGASLDSMTLDEWERVLSVNLRGTFLCCHAMIPHMKRQGSGRIVNLSSIVARGMSPRTNAAYTSCKAAITAMTRKLAIELGPFGITCNATAPGVTITKRMREQLLDSRSESEVQSMVDAIPLRRFATPEDQAKVIAFLASDDAAFVSGQTIEVTGGE
jgi:NAD(P)-dependent dehydrogenase (short-subunit alcohol dehydrogenase family)